MAWPPPPVEPQPPPAPEICQSCGMPMTRKEDFGTNADGSRNSDYCAHCLDKGKFTMPDITLEQMIEHLALIAPKFGIDEDDARAMAAKNLPKLKRWRAAAKKPARKK